MTRDTFGMPTRDYGDSAFFLPQMGKGGAGRLLFRLFLAGGLAAAQFRALKVDGNGKEPGVGRAVLTHQYIFRPLVEFFLQQLLEAALGIGADQLVLVRVDMGLEKAADKGQGLVIAAVEKQGADQGLVGAGKNGGLVAAAGGVLALAQ